MSSFLVCRDSCCAQKQEIYLSNPSDASSTNTTTPTPSFSQNRLASADQVIAENFLETFGTNPTVQREVSSSR